VALLPLDAERSLEIYGQPIASEISRTLNEHAIQVVVVGPNMAVPEAARLIVDGTITAGRAGAITISVRVRNPSDGRVLGEPLTATAAGLARLDAATSDLSGRLLPVVQAQLATAPRPDHGHVTQTAPAGDRTIVVAVADEGHRPETAALAAALDPAVGEWTRAHHHQLQKIDPARLTVALAPKAVGTGDFAIGLWVERYAPEVVHDLPMARARVRVRVASASAILFDRVIVTDTVLGDKTSTPAELAARVSREVLAILRPHLMRRVRTWE
ncbi:MAG TPA: hypothetical protein VGC42_27980, partial [Kofleriaceae bacterium]